MTQSPEIDIEAAETEVGYNSKKKIKQVFCPSCGSIAKGSVNIGKDSPRYWCSNGNCGENWNPDEIEHCIQCNSPVNGSDVICHTCWKNNTSEQIQE